MAGADGFGWSSSSNIVISNEGKHELSFDERLPLLLKCYQFSSLHRVTPNLHDYFEISFIYSGSGTLVIESESHPLQTGDTFIVGDSEFHRVIPSASSSLRALCVFFLPSLIRGAGGSEIDFEYLYPFYGRGSGVSPRIVADPIRSATILGLIRRLRMELESQGCWFRLAVKNCLLELLLQIGRYFELGSADVYRYNRRRSEVQRLRNALSYIDHNYQHRIVLGDVADLVYMSPSHFCKVFKRVTGCTLTDYVLRLRVEKARLMLVSDSLSVSEVAARAGFSSHGYFDRVFHRITGTCPNDYRASVRSK